MRASIDLNDRLLAEARRITGIRKRSALIDEALKALIERESARRLALMSGSEPRLRLVRRRR